MFRFIDATALRRGVSRLLLQRKKNINYNLVSRLSFRGSSKLYAPAGDDDRRLSEDVDR